MVLGSFFFLLNMMHCVLEGEKLKPVLEDHCDRELSDSWRILVVVSIFVPLQYILQSSAKSLYFTGMEKFFPISFIATRNSVTLSADP